MSDESAPDAEGGPRIEIHYCPRCKWLARAAWYAQELLTTFERELGEVALVPSPLAGVFDIVVDDELVFSRAAEEGFIEAKELKRRVRDRVAPERALGHVDQAGARRA